MPAPGPASIPGGEGATVNRGGERQGGVETEGQGSCCCPAGEGSPGLLSQGGAREQPERCAGIFFCP